MKLQDFEDMYRTGHYIYPNKTMKYLAAPLRTYGEGFVALLGELEHTGIFMDDLSWRVAKSETGSYYLFLMTNVKRSLERKLTTNFNDTLDKFRCHPAYVGDYPFGDLYDGHLHVIVVSMPEDYRGAYDIIMNYLNGKSTTVPYSKMYTPEQIDQLFTKLYGPNSKIVRALKKDPEYRKTFEANLNKLAVYAENYNGNERISFIELDENSELDFLPNAHDEILNHDE